MSTIGRKSLKERGLRSTEAGPDHPIYKRGLIIGGVSTSPLSKSGPDSGRKPQEEPSASSTELTKEEIDRQFQAHLKGFHDEIAEAALNQWGASPSEDTEDAEDE